MAEEGGEIVVRWDEVEPLVLVVELLEVLKLEAVLVEAVDEPFSPRLLPLLSRCLRGSRLVQLANAAFPFGSLDVPENELVRGLATRRPSSHLVAEEQFQR